MKTVIYKGEPAAIGRFGTVESGAHLQLTEAEFAGVKDDPAFELISRRKPLRDIPPLGTPFFDLRVIEWDNPRLPSYLEKEGKSTLKNIAEAMCLLGAEVVVTVHDNTPLIVDAILAEAKALKWEQYDRDARRELPVYEEEEDEDEDSDSDYSKLTVNELKALCEERGLATSGNKAALISRLIVLSEDKDDDSQSEESDDADEGAGDGTEESSGDTDTNTDQPAE